MAVQPNEILNRVWGELSQNERYSCQVLLDSRLHRVGEKVKVGLAEVPMPTRGFCVFVDFLPKANWGHPVAYFIVDADSGSVTRLDGHFPPYSGDPPEYFQVLFRPPESE